MISPKSLRAVGRNYVLHNFSESIYSYVRDLKKEKFRLRLYLITESPAVATAGLSSVAVLPQSREALCVPFHTKPECAVGGLE